MDGIHLFLNGARGTAVVRTLLASGHEIDAVYVPEGVLSALGDALSALGVPVRPISNPNDETFIDAYRAAKPRLGVIAGYSTIFRDAVIAVPALGTINLHAGPLPGYRGGSPLNWQIINGEREAGISVIRIDNGIDSGDVLTEARIPMDPRETIATLQDKVHDMFPRLVLSVVEGLAAGRLTPRVQNPAQVCYWHQRNADDGLLQFDRLDAVEADRMIRALAAPYPGAFCFWGDKRVVVRAAHVPDELIRGTPGRVCHIQGQGPYVVCRDRALLLDDYEIDGGASRLPHGIHLR